MDYNIPKDDYPTRPNLLGVLRHLPTPPKKSCCSFKGPLLSFVSRQLDRFSNAAKSQILN